MNSPPRQIGYSVARKSGYIELPMNDIGFPKIAVRIA